MSVRLTGDVGLVVGDSPGAQLIRLGDRIKAARLGLTPEPYNHVVLFVGGQQIVEADPKGARLASVGEYKDVTWFRWHEALTAATRENITSTAGTLVGTEYSWLDIAALTLDCLGLNVQRADGHLTWIGKRISDPRQLICSALADYVYRRVGLQLFDDGRLPGEVTPGDLARCPRLVKVA